MQHQVVQKSVITFYVYSEKSSRPLLNHDGLLLAQILWFNDNSCPVWIFARVILLTVFNSCYDIGKLGLTTAFWIQFYQFISFISYNFNKFSESANLVCWDKMFQLFSLVSTHVSQIVRLTLTMLFTLH